MGNPMAVSAPSSAGLGRQGDGRALQPGNAQARKAGAALAQFVSQVAGGPPLATAHVAERAQRLGQKRAFLVGQAGDRRVGLQAHRGSSLKIPARVATGSTPIARATATYSATPSLRSWFS